MSATGTNPESPDPEASASGAEALRPEAWEQTAGLEERAPGETLVVDVAGFEGRLDLLLALARTQKVDLSKISVLALAEQYLVHDDEAALMASATQAYKDLEALFDADRQDTDSPDQA